MASGAFYGMMEAGVLKHSYLNQYFAGHPVEYVTTVMFFIGLAHLLLNACDLLAEHHRLQRRQPVLGPVPRGGQPASEAAAMLDRLERSRQDDWLRRRLWAALEYVRRRNSAEDLEEQLRYLADLDADRVHQSDSLFRVIVWAIPILGFLGTVIGITLAIANLSPGQIEESLPQAINGLSVAFATTTQALSLSIVLMFSKFLVGRLQSAVLDRVDRRVEAELLGRFEAVADSPEGQLTAVRRMAELVLEASERLVTQQVELWNQAMTASQQRWADMADSSARQWQAALGEAMQAGLQTHAKQLAAAEQSLAQRNREHWDQVQHALVHSATATEALQREIRQEAEVLARAVEATGQIAKLEETLNRNLGALAGAKHFEQTLVSLAAAVQLLVAHLGRSPEPTDGLNLDLPKKPSQAA